MRQNPIKTIFKNKINNLPCPSGKSMSSKSPGRVRVGNEECQLLKHFPEPRLGSRQPTMGKETAQGLCAHITSPAESG